MKVTGSGRRQDFFVFVGLGLIGLLFFWPYLFDSSQPAIYPVSDLGTDLPREIIPLWMYIRDTITTTGALPLWRPYSASGAPIIGHPVAPLLYPPHWLSVGLPLILGLNLDAFLHFWWLGIGVYLVLRDLEGLRWEAAAVGAVLFSFAPKWVAHLSGGHWPMLAAIAWWPWAWYGFRKYWHTEKLRWMVLLGIALAAQAVNHASYLALSLILLGAATVGKMPAGWKRWVKQTVYGWGTTGIVLAGLSAGQILPLLELIPFSNRSDLTLSEITFGSLPPSLLLGLLYLPDLKFPEWFIYPGVCGLVLAAYGWSTGWSTRERWWAAGGLLSAGLSLGAFTPVYAWVLRIIPGFRFLRVPARWWIFTLFFLTLLASWGFGRWLAGVPPHKKRLTWSLSLLTTMSIGGGVIKLINPALFPFNALPSAFLMAAVVGVLLLTPIKVGRILIALLLVAESAWVTTNLIRPQNLDDLILDQDLTAYLAVSTAAGGRIFSPYRSLFSPRLVEAGLQTADGYDSFLLAHYADFVRQMIGCGFAGYAVSVPPTLSSPAAAEACHALALDASLARLLNIGKVVLPEGKDLPDADLAYFDGVSQVFDIGPGLGRAFGIAHWKTTDSDHCLDEITRLDTTMTALVETDLPASPVSAPPKVLSSERTANREIFLVQADEPGLLVRSETWAPGWLAEVGGDPRDVLRVNCAIQGVWLEKGDHEVQFEYAPLGWRVGYPVSVGTALILGIVTVWILIKERSDKTSLTRERN